MNLVQQIIDVTSAYFDNTIDYSQLKTASDNYKNLLYRIGEQDLDNEDGRTDIERQNQSLWYYS